MIWGNEENVGAGGNGRDRTEELQVKTWNIYESVVEEFWATRVISQFCERRVSYLPDKEMDCQFFRWERERGVNFWASQSYNLRKAVSFRCESVSPHEMIKICKCWCTRGCRNLPFRERFQLNSQTVLWFWKIEVQISCWLSFVYLR